MSEIELTDFLTTAQADSILANDFALDVSASINAALAALPARGGDVVCNLTGGYRLDSPVLLGDGTASSVSTRNGMRLVGKGRGYGFDGLLSPFSPVRFKMFGATGTSAVRVNGPVNGWGLEGVAITVNAASPLTSALQLWAASFGDVNNLQIVGPTNFGVIQSTRFGGASAHNKWDNVFIHLPAAAPDATALLITGDPASDNGTYFDSWRNLVIQPSVSTHTGIHLQYADSVSFWNTRINKTGGAPAKGIVFNYAVKPLFPSDNTFFALDPFDNSITNAGTAPTGTMFQNEIHGLLRGNAAAVPSLPNLVVK
jgi:hypothetical protein